MKKTALLLVIFLIFSVLTMSGCKKAPYALDVVVQSYPKDGVTYTQQINAFSFFDQFRQENVKIAFTETTFTLKYYDKVFEGTWEEIDESLTYHSVKGALFFDMDDGNGNVGTGYSARWGFDGMNDYLAFTYIGGAYNFVTRDYEATEREDYSLERELEEECNILNRARMAGKRIGAENPEAYYGSGLCEYECGEITKIDNRFYFGDNRLDLSLGFFYDFDGSSIIFADSIRTGNCILKRSGSCSYYAVFYLDGEAERSTT